MGDAGYEYLTVAVVDRVDDAVVAHADAVVVLAGELHGARWARLVGESINRGTDSILQ
jgi:hypothetical protein